MLSYEQAQNMLKAFQREDWREERYADVARLPHGLRQIGRTLLDAQFGNGALTDWAAREEAWDNSAARLDDLKPQERQSIFAALFPGISEHVEQAWQLHVRLPYHHRYPFRAPNTPQTTQPNRSAWLRSLLRVTEGYQEDIAWFAAWAPYLGWGASEALGVLCAAAIDAGGKEGANVMGVLRASARGEHEIGAMGKHVTHGLLLASRPEGWEFVERLLLAAQQQEGLRQAILESVHWAHPEAFRRMLRLILQHRLARFSATVRAVNLWFDFGLDAESGRYLPVMLEQVLQFLEEPTARANAIKRGDAQRAYLALWTLAFNDAVAALRPAVQLLDDPDAERRFVAVHLLAQLGLIGSQKALLKVLHEGEDLRMITRVLMTINRAIAADLRDTDLFERIEHLLPRFPSSKKTLPPIVWPWMELAVERRMAASALVASLGDRSPKRLIRHLPAMDPVNRGSVAEMLIATKPWDAEIREAVLRLAADSSREVRHRALEALATSGIGPHEVAFLESLLTRTADDLRRSVLALLLKQEDYAVLASAQRLLASPHLGQRHAGLELLRQMVGDGRLVEKCQDLAAQYRIEHTRLTDDEARLLDALLTKAEAPATLDDALGLLDRRQCTPVRPPQARVHDRPLVTAAAVACLQSLDDLIHTYRTTAVLVETWDGKSEELLLGSLNWRFPSPRASIPVEEDATRLPLREVWEEWQRTRGQDLRDTDGLELIRALASFYQLHWSPYDREPAWLQHVAKTLYGEFDTKTLRYANIVRNLLRWLIRLHPPARAADYLLDCVEVTLTLVPEVEIAGLTAPDLQVDWRKSDRLLGWLALTREYRTLCPDEWSDAHHVRLWQLVHWLDQPTPGAPRYRPMLEEILAAYRAGGATAADLLDQLLGPRAATPYGAYGLGFGDLARLTSRKPSPLLNEYPALRELVDRCRARIIAVELGRGELPTAASEPARALRSVFGVETLVCLLQALGRSELARNEDADRLSKAAVLSHLIRIALPAESDTVEDFAARITAAQIPRRRLVELAVYAPQWASYVEHILQQPQFAEGVWWIYAHTKDPHWFVDPEIRELWAAQVNERTPLTGQRLLDGAVDVAWFQRVYAALGQPAWEELCDAAKYSAGGKGYGRARLFADAMLGRIEKTALVASITQKRHQDAVRALGLLPLAGDDPEQDLLERYRIIQEFKRTSKQFGAMRRANEELAALIGMENLARTAGFPDPTRLEWAMEVKENQDLARGPLTVAVGDVTVSLAIGAGGKGEITATRAGRPLTAIPAQVKKDPAVAALLARKREIERQVSHMREALEQAMCRGDAFTVSELQTLLAHPVLAPLLSHLVFVGDGVMGYPAQGGRALRGHDGTIQLMERGVMLRLAHPYDLLRTNEWHLWQRDCFLAKRTQPFKQVFRELYVLTAAERAEGTLSRRYAGHQIQPRKALALLSQRGWVNHPEEGLKRTFHDVSISAKVTFLYGFSTPAEVEGLTIETVSFTKRGEWQPIELTQVPPRVFSEVMRDLDLVVSVAHSGGVDPEASASTVEMRAALIRETCDLLKIRNVRLQGVYALIEGRLSSYSVHLGSAVVHRQPGGAICIVPVHSQQRGRLFLPFADNDPKTAEVLSKVLLLARDTEIKDPTILAQILG